MIYKINQEALINNLRERLSDEEEAEKRNVTEKKYDRAAVNVGVQNQLKDLLINITGTEHFKPRTVMNGGFMDAVSEYKCTGYVGDGDCPEVNTCCLCCDDQDTCNMKCQEYDYVSYACDCRYSKEVSR